MRLSDLAKRYYTDDHAGRFEFNLSIRSIVINNGKDQYLYEASLYDTWSNERVYHTQRWVEREEDIIHILDARLAKYIEALSVGG